MIDFEKEVIDRSFVLPVVVDFWAPWCGPCQVLGPVIEKVASRQTDRWLLVKVNTQEHQDIASKYRVRSIPNVKMFYRGEVINEFMGALPEQMILDWLDKSLPNPGLLALDELLAASATPDIESLKQLHETYPDAEEIRLVFSEVVLWDDPQQASELLSTIKMGTPLYDRASNVKKVADFLLLNPEDATLKRVQECLREGKLEEGIQAILKVLMVDNKAADGKLAQAAIGIFNTLGFKHPYSKTYRRQLDMLI